MILSNDDLAMSQLCENIRVCDNYILINNKSTRGLVYCADAYSLLRINNSQITRLSAIDRPVYYMKV